MKKLLISILLILTLQSCALKGTYCYKVGQNKIVAAKMEYQCNDLFGCKEKRYSFYDNENRVFFEVATTENVICVPCDSTFQSKQLPMGAVNNEVKTNVNIQIGSDNKGK